MLILTLQVGCLPPGENPAPALPPTVVATRTAMVMATLTSSRPVPTQEPAGAPQREIVILQTNDEHGALLPTVQKDRLWGGVFGSVASWLSEGYDPRVADGPVLLLSGGDNWTGPAISTWFEGESVTELMNVMGYRASAVGNHEFDFGQHVLRERIAQADFPYLAANIYRQGTEDLVEWVKPYLLVRANGIVVGIIGLAGEETPQVTAAKNLEGLSFGAYEPALRRWVPVVRQEGAQILIVQSHICPDQLEHLASQVRDLGIALFQGGHCHRARVGSAGDSLIAVSSSHWRDYVVTRLMYDISLNKIISSEQELVDVSWSSEEAMPQGDTRVAGLIAKWEERIGVVLGEVIGYTKKGLPRGSPRLQNLLVDSWLWAYPQADIAVSNVGGFRQGIGAGDITLEDIVSVLPFDNELLELQLLGSEIEQILGQVAEDAVVGGLRRDQSGRLLLQNGQPLRPEATYRLLVTDYMYENLKYPFHRYDTQPYETSIHWRQPVIDWIKAQHSSESNPIELAIDGQSRALTR